MRRPDKEKAPPDNGADSRSPSDHRPSNIPRRIGTVNYLPFLSVLWVGPGWVGIARKQSPDSPFVREMLHWPVDSGEIVDEIRGWAETASVYYTPALFETAEARADKIRSVRACWLDCDDEDSLKKGLHLDPEPTLMVKTSPGKGQLLWLVRSGLSAGTGQGINRRLVELAGADPSGSNPNKFLRLPGTWNRKYRPACWVGLRRISGLRYSSERLAAAFPPVHTPGAEATDAEVSALLAVAHYVSADRLPGIVRDTLRHGRGVGPEMFRRRSGRYFGFLKDMCRAGLSEADALLLALECRDRWLADKIKAGGYWDDAGVLRQLRKAAEAVSSEVDSDG